ncbi:protein YIPF6-like [Styela clava]|uniref:protein YIPF6-like n=1 Tax=Styela clava TaxID=7725 RepID=UPI00193AAB94|nr:protein YIPF6-like [Styela clava]
MSDFQEISYDNPVDGDISVPIQQPEDDLDELSTLDEPVRVTFMRDFKAIGSKFVHVVYPKKDKTLLRDWDLWGPLILCCLMAIFLQGQATDEKTGEGGPQFAEVFVVIWVGAAVVTLNSQLLGGEISFFQSVCVLGYCMFPLVASLIFSWLIVHFISQNIGLFIVRFIAVFLAYGWSIFASVAFLGDSQPPNRKALAVYPICLFYLSLAWMIVTLT